MVVLNKLEELVMVHGVSGYEDEIRAKIRSEISEFAVEISEDNIGNLIATTGTGEKHLVLIAHMDEVGFVVSQIESNGVLRMRKIGGIDDRTLPGSIVEIRGRAGIVHGVIGIKPPHLITEPDELKKTIPIDRLAVDVGTRSEKETRNLGIDILSPAVIRKQFCVMSRKYIISRSLDNRIGCYVLLEAMKKLVQQKTKYKFSFVWSVQEESGLRGAIVIAHTLKPDIVFAIDTYSTTDAPEMPTYIAPIKLGKGPVLRMIDTRAIASPKLRDIIILTAKKAGIPLQIGLSGGTTDGAAAQETGALMMPIGIPLRYTHSPVEVAHTDDIDNAVKLVVKVCTKPP